jgi:hypothetical protein
MSKNMTKNMSKNMSKLFQDLEEKKNTISKTFFEKKKLKKKIF